MTSLTSARVRKFLNVKLLLSLTSLTSPRVGKFTNFLFFCCHVLTDSMQFQEGVTADLLSSMEVMAGSVCLPVVGRVLMGGANHSIDTGERHDLAGDHHVQLIPCECSRFVAAGAVVLPTELPVTLTSTAATLAQELVQPLIQGGPPASGW